MRLADRVAIVTGGGRGIGRAICRAMAREGARVIVADIDPNLGRETVDLVTAFQKAAFVEADVTDPETCRGTVQRAVEIFGTVDILVNNAGRLIGENRQTLDSLDEREWDMTMAINLRGVYFMSRAAAEVMKARRRGSIINIASTAGQIFSREGIAYGVSKGGVRALTGSLAVVLAPYGIRVNAVGPGIVITETRPRPERDQIAKRIPLGKLAVPEDVAGPVVFFASDEAGHITGQTLLIDGGMTIMRPW